MKAKSFRISTRHSGMRRFIRVSIHPDADSMRTAALRHSKREGWIRDDEYALAHGVTHIVDVRRINPDGSETRKPMAAHVRLYDGALSTGVVVHEATHAAMAIYNQDCLAEAPVHEGMDREEILAYLVGDLSAAMVNKLYEFGYYGKNEDA